ncbi:MAG: LLM class flavin-dependent oxidoreductase, partial [Dehalococcoidia bacterium]
MDKIRFGVGIFGNEPVQKIAAQVKLAEELGYDSAWLIDSQLVCRELYVTLTACALSTSRIKLGSGVTLPYTRHAFATLNEIAEERLLLGVSIGLSAVRTVGIRPARIQELEAYVGLLKGLLDNQKVPFERGMEGKITWMESPSNIPVYIAASGPHLTRAAGRMADGAILHHGVTVTRLERAVRLV